MDDERAIVTGVETTLVGTDGQERVVIRLADSLDLDASDGRGVVDVGEHDGKRVLDLFAAKALIDKIKKDAPDAHLAADYDALPAAVQAKLKLMEWLTGATDPETGQPVTVKGTVAEWIAAGRPEVVRAAYNPNSFQGRG